MNTEVLRKEARFQCEEESFCLWALVVPAINVAMLYHTNLTLQVGTVMVPTLRMREFSLSNGHRAHELAAVRFKAGAALLLSLPTFQSRWDKDWIRQQAQKALNGLHSCLKQKSRKNDPRQKSFQDFTFPQVKQSPSGMFQLLVSETCVSVCLCVRACLACSICQLLYSLNLLPSSG